ncbi:hypothetical protein PR202_gb02846 [Eleusine coracana subsp. coracana]|uniref:Nitronate monooxygenase domain-containing protein n=1 Tax=Eleusine coracana subsp. coracana TaxID=191504 RepID=A0AAV5E0B2_ELECO|nr:hypothetical protein PR202_gb02846 [Eleusine coracana subsp. coracana]
MPRHEANWLEALNGIRRSAAQTRGPGRRVAAVLRAETNSQLHNFSPPHPITLRIAPQHPPVSRPRRRLDRYLRSRDSAKRAARIGAGWTGGASWLGFDYGIVQAPPGPDTSGPSSPLPTPAASASSASPNGSEQIGSLEDAAKAKEAGVDGISVQGCEAGDRVIGQEGLLPMLPKVVDLVSDSDTKIIAAGGIVDGHGYVDALALAAQGVCLGTRFLATEESLHILYISKT